MTDLKRKQDEVDRVSDLSQDLQDLLNVSLLLYNIVLNYKLQKNLYFSFRDKIKRFSYSPSIEPHGVLFLKRYK